MRWGVYLAVAAIIYAIVQRIIRSRSHRRIAERLGFQFLGFEFPVGFSLRESHLLGFTDVVGNVMHGTFQGLSTVIFDHHSNGEAGYIQTVAAMRSSVEGAELGTLWKASELTVRRVGEWILIYRPKVQVQSGEIPAFLTDCANLLTAMEDKQTSTTGR